MTPVANSSTILDRIDGMFEDEVDFLRRLVQIPSQNPPGEYETIAGFVESFAKNHGIRVEVLETPAEFCRSLNVEGGKRLSVKTTIGTPGVKPRILLLSHLDTVPAGDASAWKHGPLSGEIAEGRLYGRGSCDCKGRIASYVFAQLALAETLSTIPCEVSVACTADEEIGGSTGAKYLLENGKLDCDYCIGEGYTWEVFHGFKGLLWVKISLHGKSAHGATPQLGVSAVKPLETLFKQIREFQANLDPESTLNVGTVRAGTKINMVPDSATVEIDIRMGGVDNLQKTIKELENTVRSVERLHSDVSIKMDILNRSEPISVSPDDPLVKTVHASVEEVTKSQIPVKLWFAHSDTLHFMRKGISSVNYGVGRAGIAHTTDEYIYLDDLKIGTKAVALSVMKLMSK